MTHTDTIPRQSWLGRSEAWLDDRGKGAWIALMVLSFVFVWPLGLAILAYMIWSKRMFGSCSSRRRGGNEFSRDFTRGMGMGRGTRFGSSGNTAFDAYKSDTLARLEREQEEFESFLRRLRESKDKSEFDQYMTERAREAANPQPETAPVPQGGDSDRA